MITRRASLVLSAKAVAALMAAGPLLPGCGRSRVRRSKGIGDAGLGADAGTDKGTLAKPDTGTSDGRISWDAFLKDLAILAQTQFTDDWNQAAYVLEVTSLMALLNLEDEAFDTLYDGYVDAMGSFPEIATVHEGGFFEVATLEFDPGDQIPLHNHPDMTGVILCIKGKIDVEGFNLLDRSSPSGRLLFERVANETLQPGSFATLTQDHGNIHALKAVEHTELLDVFTPPYDKERLTRYHWYGRSSAPIEGDNIFEAWET